MQRRPRSAGATRISSGASTARLSARAGLAARPSPPRTATTSTPATSAAGAAASSAATQSASCCHSSWMSVPSSPRISSRKRFLSLSAIWPMRCLDTPKRSPSAPSGTGSSDAGQVLVPDGALALVGQAGGELLHQVGDRARQLAARGLGLGRGAAAGQPLLEGDPLVVGARVERDLARGQVGRHLLDVGLVDVQLGRQQLGGGVEPGRQQLLPLALQAEEQLATGARVAHVDEARVGHQEPQDVGPDPVGGVRAEARAQGGVPVLDRLEQPDAALLEQVEHVGPGLPVLVGDADHQPQVVHHQGARGARCRRARAPP